MNHNSMPRFSIIMPLYNKAPYVRKALESVVAQTFPDWELVAVDDGSTDGGADIVRAIPDSRVSLLQQPNSGVSTARNNGVDTASGEYLCFLDADDWWAPTFLEEMNGLIARHPDAGLYATSYHLVKHGRSRPAPIGVDADFAEGAINYCAVYAKTLCMPVWTGAVCMRRATFTGTGGFSPSLAMGEDFDLWLHMAQRYEVVLLNRQLAYYNQDADSRFRATGRLCNPDRHVLWHLGDMEPIERTDPDYKFLVDQMRTYGLFPYYLARRYRESARRELAKVDWAGMPRHWQRRYRTPVALLKVREVLLRCASQLKGLLCRISK
ncbi:MAG: family 2 glycosyl transferase [bacterium P3]|nr:MAG: family 2 glycosyl transferase [bacterium P201]KWW30485.1 MAG: family 2 glycosyl transferase [bacterium P3]KWW41372.1 MAG: family 2 glycosyl transferase [bacterium F083]